jgi:hypothetical protein
MRGIALLVAGMNAVFQGALLASQIAGHSPAGYIAGDDMPASTWMKALHIWPELAERFEETISERAMQSRQVSLELDPPMRRDKAA